jgi:hypothetical protein
MPTREEQCAQIIAHLMRDPCLTRAAKANGVSVRTMRRWMAAEEQSQVDLGGGIIQPFGVAVKTALGCGREEQTKRNISGLRRGSVKRAKPWDNAEEIIIDPEPRRNVVRVCDDPVYSPSHEADRRAATMSKEERERYSTEFARANVQPITNSAATPRDPPERLGSAPSGIKIGQTMLLPGGVIGKRVC